VHVGHIAPVFRDEERPARVERSEIRVCFKPLSRGGASDSLDADSLCMRCQRFQILWILRKFELAAQLVIAM
jgi:hypothetical protein